MTMFRAAVRNTFLVFEVVEQQSDDRVLMCRRSKSADLAYMADVRWSNEESDMLECLKTLGSNRQVCTASIEAECKQRGLKRSDSSSSLSTVASLKKAGSTCSMSSMASEEWESEDAKRCKRPCSTAGFHHGSVPRNVDLARESSRVSGAAAPTTMMIRNIPNRYSQEELIDELDRLGFGQSFDFFYSPIDVGTLANVGYAFVNFIDATWARQCQEVIDGYAFEKYQKASKTKMATVSVAHLQGLEANIRHYENSKVSRKARSKRSGPVVITCDGTNKKA